MIYQAISDGTQVLSHDGVDVQSWHKARETFPKLAKLEAKAGKKLVTAPALARDFFWALHKRIPRPEPLAPLKPSYDTNAQVLKEILATKEFQDLRAAGTVGDLLTTSIATTGLVESTLKSLDKETIEQLNQLNELEQSIEYLMSHADTLEELAPQANQQRAAQLRQIAQKAREQALGQEQSAATIGSALQGQREQIAAQVRRAARLAANAAAEEISLLQAAAAAFGGSGYSMMGGATDGTGLSVKDKLELAKQINNNDKLKLIAKLAGRMKFVAEKKQREKVDKSPTEVSSVTFGNELARLLPSESVLLADPDLQDLFLLRFAESQLAQYKLEAHEPKGKGPIILALDSSGSMSGDREVWSKAVMLALLGIAKKQKRNFFVIHFSGKGYIKTFDFLVGESTYYSKTIQAAEFFYGGGTEFEQWMVMALEKVDESDYEDADVICVSDGEVAISHAMKAEWATRRKSKKMRVYSILIGTESGKSLLGSISDAMMSIEDLTDDRAVLDQIFAI